jgi:two-component system sensor histidine kinase KdpD
MPSSKHPKGFGRHKIFLGYAPGVGKTYQMLEESIRRKARGQDVVMALVNAPIRPATAELSSEFETITSTNGALDVDAIVARKPDLVMVDEIQLPNPAGSKHSRRWEDVEELLRNGISVLSTLDVMYLESLNDAVSDITGTRPSDTVPDRILHEAEEVELVDLTPRALLNRVERGAVYSLPLTKTQEDFFRLGNLSALREIAMREAASHVDEDLAEYRKEKRIEKPWAAKDRVLICISPTRSSLRLIRRGWRMGQRMHGDVTAVYVQDGPIGDKEQKVLESDFALCTRLGIQTETLKGPVTETVIKFAREQSATAIILGHPERSRVSEIFRPSILSELSRELRTVDIIVVATELPTTSEH